MTNKIIKRLNPKITVKNGQKMLTIYTRPTAEEGAFIKAHKQEIIDAIEQRDVDFENTVTDILEGRKNILFKLVGCDNPRYVPTVIVPENLQGQEQKILSAVYARVGKSIEEKYGYIRKDQTTDQMTNVLCGENKYFVADVVSSYEMKLSDILSPVLEAEKAQEKVQEDKKENALQRAKETGERQIIDRWTEDCTQKDCSNDIVTFWAMPDGTTQTTRTHTY
ncbi:MAG TPA: hypothetical protein VFD28_00630 [Candidatus Eisenbacteria bacterium]|nr:hypothetical protein [Candidatus Eisenbacteria bacterium]